jgi:carboxypeptidase family protein/TonB-dependent receptor-like protein
MRTFRRQAIVVVLSAISFLFVLGSPLAAQNVRGKLLELGSQKPVPDVVVVLVAEDNPSLSQGMTQRTTTSNTGTFALRAPGPGVYRVRADRPGYRTAITPAIALQPGDDIGIAVRLLPDTAQLRPVVVTANNRRPTGRLGGFYDRMSKRLGGYFITRDDIQKRNPLLVSDLLRTIPGLEVLPSARAFGYDIRTVEGCRPAVFLDGLPLPLMRGETIDDLVNPMDVEGIEVYRHAAEVPVQFQRGSACGAIVIWTRTGA